MFLKVAVFIISTWCLSVCDCARILAIAPLPSYSHQVAFRPIWKELASRGHNVTLITTDAIKDPALINLTEIDVHDETYRVWRESGIITLMQNKWNQINPFAMASIFMDLCSNLSQVIMDNEDVKKLLADDNSFDLVMTEPFLSIGLGFSEYYNSKLILVTSLEAPSFIHRAVGNPLHPTLYPEAALPVSTKTYLNRFIVTTLFLFHYFFRSFYFSMQTDLLKKHFGENTPPLEQIMEKTNMVFVNVNPLFAGVRPVTPSTIYYGAGSHLEPEKPLVKDLKDYLDGAENGVVYFSLGTNVLSKDLPEDKRKMLLDAFRELPFRFLWKFEDDSLQNLPENVKITKWVAQQDVLRHPKVKVFITQGGLQSTEEAIFSKVPIIGMPQIADQFPNVERIVELAMGVLVDFKNLNKDELKRTIIDVVTNSSYRESMEEFVKLSIDRPMSGIEEAAWWTEYVLRHNNTEHLKGPVRHIPLYEYLLLDVLAGLLLIIFIIIYLIVKLVKFICTFLCKRILGKPHKD